MTPEKFKEEVAVLTRWGSTPSGTFGELRHRDFRCYTVERPWENNRQFISCIPADVYKMRLSMYYGGDGPGGKSDYPAYRLLAVPNRTYIKIHKANLAADLLGCIALGTKLGYLENTWAVLNSREAYGKFMESMGGEQEAFLEIVWDTPERGRAK